jgi:Leucine rich repeat
MYGKIESPTLLWNCASCLAYNCTQIRPYVDRFTESSDTPSIGVMKVEERGWWSQNRREQTGTMSNRAKKHGNVSEEEDKKPIQLETSALLDAGAPGRDDAFDSTDLADRELLDGGDGRYSLEMESLTRGGSEHEDRPISGLERTSGNVDVEVGEIPAPLAAGAGGNPRGDGELLSVDAIVREIARLQDMLRVRMDSKRPSPTELLDAEIEDSDDVGIAMSREETAYEDSWERTPALVRSERRQVASKPGAVRVFPGEARTSNEDDSVSLESQPPAPPGTSRLQIPPTTRSEDAILLEADLVADQVEQSEASVSVALLVEAKIIRRKRQALVMAGLVCLSSMIVAIAVGVPLYLSQNGGSASGSLAEGRLDTVSVTSLQSNFSQTLANSTVEAIGQDTSPQAKAYLWLFEAGDALKLPRDEAMKRMAHRFALATLYYSTGGDSWRTRSGWLEKDVHECLWQGVTCANVTFNAVSYCKDQQGVLREVSDNILNVTEVERIDLSGNGLNGSLPDELSLLVTANVRDIALDGNNIGGKIPSGLGDLTTLQYLSLSQNAIEGILPEVGKLGRLKTLKLFQNKLTGSIPAAIYRLTDLTLLDVEGNAMTGTISKEVGQLSKLTELNIWTIEGLTGSLPTELGRLTGLTQIYILSSRFSGPRLSGPIPSELGNLSNLTNLILSGYLFDGTIPPELSRLTLLDWLYLQRNELSGSIPSELGRLTKLGELDVSANTALTGSVPESLCSLIGSNNLVVKVSCDVINCSATCGCSCV